MLKSLELKSSDCAGVCRAVWLGLTLTVKQYHPSQLTELKSAKPEVESLWVLLDAEDGAKGSLPLKGSPRPFLL